MIAGFPTLVSGFFCWVFGQIQREPEGLAGVVEMRMAYVAKLKLRLL